MKTILLPTHPKYCYLTYGTKEKTEEIRKTAPDPPFKVLSYCTSVKNMNLNDYVTLHRKTNGLIDDWHSKVIGEFIVNEVEQFTVGSLRSDDIQKLACLSYTDLINHFYKTKELDGNTQKTGYALHITAPKLYDKPRELREFSRECVNDKNCDNCDGYQIVDGGYECSAVYDCVYDGLRPITRAPQSWIYIQDPEEESK